MADDDMADCATETERETEDDCTVISKEPTATWDPLRSKIGLDAFRLKGKVTGIGEFGGHRYTKRNLIVTGVSSFHAS